MNLELFSSSVPAFEGFRWELVGRTHTPSILRWRNDPQMSRWFYSKEKLTEEMQNAFLESYKERDRLDLVLVDSENDRPVGVFSVKNASTRPELGKLIGESDYRGRGLASPATVSFISAWFELCGGEELFAETMNNNERNIRVNRGLGFKTISQKEVDGSVFLVMNLTKKDFYERD